MSRGGIARSGEGIAITRDGDVITRDGDVITRDGDVITRDGDAIPRESGTRLQGELGRASEILNRPHREERLLHQFPVDLGEAESPVLGGPGSPRGSQGLSAGGPSRLRDVGGISRLARVRRHGERSSRVLGHRDLDREPRGFAREIVDHRIAASKLVGDSDAWDSAFLFSHVFARSSRTVSGRVVL
jgi:hypothetical protein